MGMSDNAKWLILAVASSVFIGMSFILKKKGLKQAGSTGTGAAQDLPASMSTQGASTSSPSSSSTPRRTYDVFLSFRGEDTRKCFTDHLYNALENKGILTFRDDEKLERGKFISQELVKAIEESKFAIVIFSVNYAFSTWCLDELDHIARCRKEKGLEVFPIFYHVEPSDIRKQKGIFGKAFDKYKESFKEKVETWRSSLSEVANLSGWDLQDSETPSLDLLGTLLCNNNK
nr:isoform 2 of tmv resistance protein n [Quercus suber]